MIVLAQPAVGTAEEPPLATAGAWEARTADLADEGGRRCLIRALDPVLAEGDVFWIFDPGHRDSLPDGFLVVDRRLAGDATAAALTVSPGGDFTLARGHDLHFYSRGDDSPALFEELRRGLTADLMLSADGAAAARTIRLSLIGFTQTSTAARQACRF